MGPVFASYLAPSPACAMDEKYETDVENVTPSPPPFDERRSLEAEQAEREVAHVVDERLDDPNMDHRFIEKAEEALETGDVKQEVTVANIVEEDSPYIEVRAAVSNVDDPEMPVNTIRSWFLGLIAAIVVPGANQLLSLRFPSTTISAFVVIIFAYPLGQLLEKTLPTKKFRTRLGTFTLNPGPFNVKEHALVSIMSLMSYQSAYATLIPGVQRFTYNQDFGFGYGVLLVLSTQLIGLSFACLMRRILVYPAHAIFPTNLPMAVLLNTLHGVNTAEGTFKGMSRYKFFWIAFILLFCYQFLPGYLFRMLSDGNWLCLIAPNNVPLNQILGTVGGIGLIPLTFDWQIISYANDPLAVPWWANANTLGGFVIFFVIVVPAIYYTNTWNTKYLPMFSTSIYDRFGKEFDVFKVIDKLSAGRMVFNPDKYNNYSQQYLPAALLISYFLSFASITAVIVHVALFHGKSIWRQLRQPFEMQADVHMRLMMRYKETPRWVYGILFLVSFAMGIGALYGWESQLPWWAFIVAILIGAFFLAPIGVVQSQTGTEVGLNMLSELIVGYMLPGRPYAMMIFKTTMYMITSQGLAFISDQKLAHYMKVPPRSVFAAQLTATVVGGIVQLAVQTWAFSNIHNICKKNNPDKFTCAQMKTFATASEVWGLIGPKINFEPGRYYNSLLYGFLVGAIAPVFVWLLAKKFPKSGWRLVNLPVVFSGTGNIPPAVGAMYLAPAAWGFVFNYVLKRYRSVWWAKYNYMLSAALNGGSAIATVVIYFALQFPKQPNDFYENGWWGNTASSTPLDASSFSYWHAPKEGFAGTPAQIGLTA